MSLPADAAGERPAFAGPISAEQILESISEAFLAIDAEWRFTYFNAAAERISGQRRDDLVGRNHWEVYPAAVGTPVYHALARAMTDRVPTKFLNHYEPWDKWFEGDAYPTPDGGIAVYYRDITERKRAEEELARVAAESERRQRTYETVLSSTVDFNYVFDLDGRFVYVNRALLDLWGKDLAEAVGKDFFELEYPNELAARLQRQIQEVIDTKRPVRDETPYTSAIGTRAYEYIFVPVFAADGTVEAVAGSTRDITERREHEESVRANEERFRAVFDSMDEGFCVVEMIFDEARRPVDYRILEMNPAFEKHTGLRNAAGKRVRELAPDLEAHWFETYGRVALTGEPERFVNRAETMDGRWFDVYAFRLGDAGSQRVAVLFNDITARTRAEVEREQLLKEVDAERERLADVFRRAPSFMCVLSGPDHVFTLANDRYYQLVGHRDILGKPVREALPEVEGQGFFELLDEVYRTGQPFHGQDMPVMLQREPGRPTEQRSMDLVYQATRSPDGTITGIFAQGIDITDRTRAEGQLREANRRKDEFLATLAHELRNPLAPISNALQVWGQIENDHQKSEQLRGMMERQVRQLVRLIDDLLDVSRITRGRIALQKARIDLRTVVEESLESVRPLADANCQSLVVTLPEEPLPVSGDVGRLIQVVGNILNNASKYTGRDGRIELSAAPEGVFAVVRVRDNGPGIPPEMLGRIFEMFTQVDRTLDRSQGGLGIGLTLVKTLVEMHGGLVEASSEGPGRGSEFVVRLPLLPSAGEDPSDKAPHRLSPLPPLPRRRILVVDDIRPSATTLALMLKALGQDAKAVYDGTSAVRAVSEFGPDIVISDIGMPGMDGYEFARRILDTAEPRPVLVALTGYGQEDDRRQALAAGFEHHLVKPTSVDALRELLRAIATGSTKLAP